MKKIIYITPLITLVLIGFLGFSAINKMQKKSNLANEFNELRPIPFPEFSLRDLYDQTQTLSRENLIGKLSLVNVFSSWCTSCSEEHKLLLEISTTGLIDVYGIAWRDIDENTIRYLEKRGNPYLKVATDNKGLLSGLIGINGVPETFILNKDGAMIYRHRGPLDKDFIDYLDGLVQER